MSLFLMIIFAFLAGFIDSVAGGGGMIQLPALFVFFPGLHGVVLLGTNKFAAFSGTCVAAYRYVRNMPQSTANTNEPPAKIPWDAILPAIAMALIFSVLGARVVSYLNKDAIKPVILCLLILVVIYTVVQKNFGLHHLPKLNKTRTLVFSLLTGATLGFYDGFFGPGTGSFLIVIFISIFGFNFLIASASAKLVNCATNVAALAYFVYAGDVRYDIAIPVALSNMAGNFIGAKMAVKKGSSFVRILFLVIVTGMIIKFSYDVLISK